MSSSGQLGPCLADLQKDAFTCRQGCRDVVSQLSAPGGTAEGDAEKDGEEGSEMQGGARLAG